METRCCSWEMTRAVDHHDVEIVHEGGTVLARLAEGLDRSTRLHGPVAEHTPPEWLDLEPVDAAGQVKRGVESDHGSEVLGRVVRFHGDAEDRFPE